MKVRFGKKATAVCLTALTAISLSMAGCSGSASSSQAASGAASAAGGSKETTTIKVWSDNRHDLKYMTDQINKFNTTNTDGIKISYQTYSDNYQNMVTMAATSQQLPDLMSVSDSDGFTLSDLVSSNVIQPLNKYMTDDFKTATGLDNLKFEQLNVLGSDVYWVPTWERSAPRLIYNKDLFSKAGITAMPKTFDDVVTDAAKITKVGGGKQFGIASPGQSGPWGRLYEVVANASGFTFYDYKAGKFNFTPYQPIIEKARAMYKAGSYLPGSTSLKVDPMRVQFSAGNIGMYGNASQEVSVLTNQFPAKMPWGVATIPSLDGTTKGAYNSSVEGGWMMAKTTAHPEQTFKVINFFSSVDFMTGYCEAGCGLPASSNVSAKVDKSKMGRLADFSLQPNEGVYPIIPSVTPSGETYDTVMWNLITSNGDIPSALNKLNTSYNNALDQAVKEGKMKRLVISNYDPLHPTKGTYQYLTK